MEIKMNRDEVLEKIAEVIRKAGEWEAGSGSGEIQLYAEFDPKTGRVCGYKQHTFAGHNNWVEGDDLVPVYTEKWFDPLEHEDYRVWFEGELDRDPKLRKKFVERLEEEGYETEKPEFEYDAFSRWFPEKWDDFTRLWAEIALDEYISNFPYSEQWEQRLEAFEAEGIDVSDDHPRSEVVVGE